MNRGYSKAGMLAASAVSAERIWHRLMAMAAFGGFPGGGVNRAAFSTEDIAARGCLLEWGRQLGLQASVDAIGNLFLRLPGANTELAPVLTGSHMDSQPQGGRFDGIYGVIAGLEALQVVHEAGVVLERGLELVAWSNEEGGRFAPGAMGSAVFSGAMDLSDCLNAVDVEQARLQDALSATLAATPDLPSREFKFPVHAYLEAHIEQGPVLEAENLPVGIVDRVQGSRWFEVRVDGEAAHAGTTPLRRRKDALRCAIAAIDALQALTQDDSDTVRFTVGRLEVEPNSPNTVPQRVRFSIDLRHPDNATLARLGDAIGDCVASSVAPCEATIRETFHREPCQFDEQLVEMLGTSATALGLPCRRLSSGAFHDAVFLAGHCPTAMIFVPCAGGISHNPAESASPSDLAAGARLLTTALVSLASA